MNDPPRTIGPYRILEALGRGGMGVVYRGEHVQTGQPAAVKTVRLPREGLLQSIRREIHALARIRHPGIVQILDEGLHEGLPWYAMELLEGVPLGQYRKALAKAIPMEEPGFDSPGADSRAPIPENAEAPLTPSRTTALGAAGERSLAELPDTTAAVGPDARALSATRAERSGRRSMDLADTTPQSHGRAAPRDASADRRAPRIQRPPAAGGDLPAVLRLIRRLCSPLAFLHGEGVVHRDLKPDNIFVRPTGWPVLMDFGLISQFGGELGREALEVAGSMAGTIAYMAPEQILGQFVDARADLYALGCILYELLTGRRPFLGKTDKDVLSRHLEAAPIVPSELVEGVPEKLEALVLRLLAKRPQQRLGHADDVAAALAGLGVQDDPEMTGPRPRAYLYRPTFVGRAKTFERLAGELGSLEAGTSGVLLIGGESGVGKTRLAMEMAREAQLRRIGVLTGECFSMRSGEPLQPLREALQAIADRCRERGLEETERLLGLRGKVLALYEPALRGLPGQQAYPEPAELPAEAARVRLYTYLAETFAALAEAGPVLLILDDLQWADELTLGFLEFVLRSGHLDRTRILFLGTYRTEELTEGVQRLLGPVRVKALELDRLDEEAVAVMVSDMLALDASPGLFVSFLSRQSEGNPFFVAEFLRTAVGEGLLFRDATGQWHVAEESEGQATRAVYEALPLPRSVRELVGRRVQGLSMPAQRLVEIGSVLGREVPESLLADAAGMDAAPRMEAIKELLARQVLEDAGAGSLRFVHDKIREVAYERLEGQRRRELHLAAAEAIEARLDTGGERHLAVLGHHWEQAEQRAKARQCYLPAAQVAQSRYAHGEAEKLYRAYLRLVDRPTAESVGARIDMAVYVLYIQARYGEVIEQLETAREEARSIGDRKSEMRSLRELAPPHRLTGQLDKAIALYHEALALTREAGDRSSEGLILDGLALLQAEHGRPEEAKRLFHQALAIHRGRGDRKLEGGTLGNLANLLEHQGLTDEASALYKQALEVSREFGNRVLEGVILGNWALALYDQGCFERAQALNEQALAIHREVGNRRFEGIILGNLFELHSEAGRYEQADPCCRKALAICRELGDRTCEGYIIDNLATMHMDRGQFQEAQALYAQALAIHREIGNRRVEGMTLGHMGKLQRLAGAFDQAEGLLQQAEPILHELNDRFELAVCLCQRGHLSLARVQPARDLLEQVQALAVTVHAAPESKPGRAIAQLRHAVEALEAGRPLFRGQCIEDLPEGLRRWLLATRQLEEPSSVGSMEAMHPDERS
jgi:predicted ATPase